MFTRVRLACLLLVTACAVCAAEPPAFVVRNDALTSPAGAGAISPELVTSPDGTVYLSWLEPAAGGAHAFRFSKYATATRTWAPARDIARGAAWIVNAADTPQLAVGAEGRLTAAWLLAGPASGPGQQGAGRAVISHSTDDGATWSAPAPLTRESTLHEQIALTVLADGRVLAAWLDGRARQGDRGPTQLFARVLADDDTASRDALVDASVCDRCQTALTAFANGDAVLAYRGLGDDGVRDIRSARFRDGTWQESRPVNHDGWKTAACPDDGPAAALSGPALGVAWFTAADGAARVQVALSSDAGGQFQMPFRVDDGHPLGQVDLTLLRDRSALVTWVENGAAGQAGIFLRRISPAGTLNVPVRLATTPASRSAGFPRIALAKDYDATPAQMLLVNAAPAAAPAGGPPPGLEVRLITLPDAAALAESDGCGCAPKEEEQRGFPLRGEIVAIDTERETLLVKHQEIPGVMRAMTMQFKVAGNVAKAMQPGRQILARMERRGAQWWLFEVRMLVVPRPSMPPAAAAPAASRAMGTTP